MKRRGAIIALTVALLVPSLVWSQDQDTPAIGVLITHAPADDPVVHALRKGLRDYGYEDGKNIRVVVRTALGDLDKVQGLADELVQLKVKAVVLVNETAARAAMKATSTIPIVLVGYTDDPLALGWIESYRHPGGNLTGIFSVDAELTAKRLEILRDALPGLSRVAVFWDNYGRRQIKDVESAGRALGLTLDFIEVKGADDLERAYKVAVAQKAEALLILWSPVFYVNRYRVGALALQEKLPTMTELTVVVRAGGLLSYGSARYYNQSRSRPTHRPRD